jgi:hypothetical protein
MIKEKIKELVSRGFTEDEAIVFVKSISRESYNVGVGDVDYDEEYGYNTIQGFDNWFAEETK